MSAPLKLYVDLMSQPCRALYIILKLNKIPFETVSVAIRKGEHLSNEFKKINRFQKLPCIVHDGFQLAESMAILRYIEQLHKFDDHWYPKDVIARARVNEYLDWHHNNTRLACTEYFRNKWLYPLMYNKQPNAEKVEEARKNLDKYCNTLETLWLTNKFLTSNTISVADIFAACEIEQTRLAGYDATLNRPVLKNWIDAVRSETSPYYEEASKFLYGFIERGVGPPTKNKL